MGTNFSWIVGILPIHGDVIMWMCQFSVSVKKLKTLSEYVFPEDVNSWKRAIHKYHKNWASTNFNDSIVFILGWVEILHSGTVSNGIFNLFIFFREFYTRTTSATWWGPLWTSMSPCLNQWPSPAYSPCVASSSFSRYCYILCFIVVLMNKFNLLFHHHKIHSCTVLHIKSNFFFRKNL